MNKLSFPFSKISLSHYIRQFFLTTGSRWWLVLLCGLVSILVGIWLLWSSHRGWLFSLYPPSLKELQEDYFVAHVYWVNCEAKASIAFEEKGPLAAEQITLQPKCIMARQTILQPQG
ncbi:hypothetical protein [Zooshikella harenae]|uniref:Uncharacterized protein n=1 Tax=Zooshikella harenae TaxID=2827238 RepID=A0ABS5ZGT7_9GAMM|nr:hypothetical protein [Zooshikella harenae]MBU2713276.1 hypothetical protein [Zooshikella harenae]